MNGRATVLVGAAVFIVLAVSACDFNVLGVRGSGNVISETRDVSDFSEIAVLGSGDVVVVVDGTESLRVEAEDNIMPLLKIEVHNGRLELSTETTISPTTKIMYTISAARLDALSVSGSGDITAIGIDVDSFDVEIDGSGRIEAAGTAGTLSVEISGSGSYVGEDLVASVGTVRVSGSGDAVVNITDDLDADVSGSGDIEYIGEPIISSSITGSGDISQR